MPETLGARAGPSPCTMVGEPMGADSSASGASPSPLATQAKEVPNSITAGYDRVARALRRRLYESPMGKVPKDLVTRTW